MGFLSLAYLTVANLNRFGISIHYQVSVRPQYLVKLLSLVRVKDCSVDTGRKLNVHKTFRRRL